ncbi:MAG: GntR family transcriptional regulator [Mobilitalea sp.]
MELLLQPKSEKENNSEYAYRILHNNIMTLQLPPGATLNENDLSSLLAVSRTPIHEAVIKLKGEYLVNVYPQSASKVSLIDLEILKEGLFLRSIVEPAIIKKIAGIISSEGLRPLKDNLNLQEAAMYSEDPIINFFKLDDEFHQSLYNLANKSKTWHSVKSICSHYDRVRYMDAVLHKTDLSDILKDHKLIYHLMQMGITKENEFDQFYRDHLETFGKSFHALIEHYSQYFAI